MPDSGRRQGRLLPIPGSPPDLVRPPVGCAFAPRCPLARERCRAEIPALRELTPGHLSACHFAEDL
jgi:oligopeptide/dipeptide ABC transporter ATP-binding protein